MNNTVKIILTFVLAAFVGFGGGYAYKVLTKDKVSYADEGYGYGGSGGGTLPKSSNTVPSMGNGGSHNSLEPKSDAVTGNEPGLIEPTPSLELNVSRARVSLTVGKDAYYYAVSGIQTDSPSDNLSYTLSDAYGHSYTSSDGYFSRVEANDAGTYSVTVKDLNTHRTSEPRQIQGFGKVAEISDKLTASDLTAMIGTGDYDGHKGQLTGKIVNDVRITCSNSEYGNRSTIQEVFMSVGLEDWTVSVTSVEYNCIGQVYSMNLNVSK